MFSRGLESQDAIGIAIAIHESCMRLCRLVHKLVSSANYGGPEGPNTHNFKNTLQIKKKTHYKLKNTNPMIAKKPTHSSHVMMYNITKKISAMSVAFSYTACNFDGRQYLWVTMHTTPGPILITSEYDSRQKGKQNA